MHDVTVSADVDSMLRSANDAAIRSAIGVGTTDAPTFLAVTAGAGTAAAPSFNFSGDLSTGIYRGASGQIYFTSGGVAQAKIDGGVSLYGVKPIRWAETIDASSDLFLYRDGAPGILAQRNGSSPQAFRVANQVGASPLVDYDRGVFDFKTTTNTLRIGTENGGTYTLARPIEFVTGGVVRMTIAAAGLVTIDSISITRGTGTNSTNLSVGSVLSSNTTGIGNSGIGYSSLNSNTTGSFNVALGNNALQNNSTGGSNAAIGIYALNANSTGGNNMAIGGAALQANTTGSYNVAIGSLAGYYIADGATGNATGSNSLFLGSNTKALGAAQTNQTVIGDNATGSGSNSTTLNNTATTLTKIKGTSAHVLDVTGTIKLSPPASVTPANNGELMVEATSNTTLTFKFKGSDGTVRSGTVTLA